MFLCRAVIVFLLAAGMMPAAKAADELTLTAGGADAPLIFSGAGEKTLRVTLSAPTPDSHVAAVKVEVRGFNGSVERVPEVLSSTETPLLSASATDRDIICRAVLPRLGLYEATVTALDDAKHPLATTPLICAAVPPRTAIGPSDFGVCVHIAGGGADKTGFIVRSLDLIKLAGISRVRDNFYWNQFEREPGVYSFAPGYDAFARLAHERGISPLVILAYGNGAAYPSTKTGFPDQPETRAAFAQYAAQLVKRYGETVKDWEVWNEPQGWGKPTVENYTLLLQETYQAIKAIAPSAEVISCGGGGAGGGPGGDYIGGVIHAGGLNDQDGFSIHPYISPPATPDTGYEATGSVIPRVSVPVVWEHLAQFIAGNNHRKADGKPLDLWVTEFGCYSSPVPWVKGEPFQALFLTRAYLLSRRYGTAKALFWYDFQDDGTNPQNIEHNFGLIRHDFSPKPAYVAASVLTWTLGDRPWKKALVENADTRVLQYGDAADAVIAGWRVQQFGNEFVLVNVTPGTYILRDWQGVDKEIEIDEKGYRWKLGPMPQYLLPKPAMRRVATGQ